MEKLEGQPLDGFNDFAIDRPAEFHCVIDGRNLDLQTLIYNTPVLTTSYDGYNSPQLVLESSIEGQKWDEERYYPVGRLSPIHGRNIELLADEVVITDCFGNEYFSACLKGTDLSNPGFIKSQTASRDYIVRGLQESIVMERVLSASRVLRQNGVGTEYVFGLTIPDSFPLDTEKVGLPSTTPVELPTLLNHLAAKQALKSTVYTVSDGQVAEVGPSTLERRMELVNKFKDCTYIISYRAMDCPYRAGELTDESKFSEFKQFIEKAMPNTDFPDFIRDLDPHQYLKSYFPYALGKNVAKMHSAGIYHKFLHADNLTALGSIVDLDSCKGEPLGLGDPGITILDEVVDVIYMLNTFHELYNEIDFSFDTYIESDYQKVCEEHDASGYFLSVYLDERFSNVEEKISFLHSMINLMIVADRTHENGSDGDSIRRNLERILAVYHKLQTYSTSDIHIPSGCNIEIDRTQSFFKSVPANYFSHNKEKILDGYLMNDELAEDITTDMPIHNRVTSLIQNILHEKLILPPGIPNDVLVYLLSLTYDSHSKKLADTDSLEAGREYLLSQTSAILDQLSQPIAEDSLRILRPLIDGREWLKERAGLIYMEGNKLPPTEILYLENDQEYIDIFNDLGIDDHTPIRALTAGEITGLTEQRVRFGPRSLIISDYAASQYVAEATKEDEIFEALFYPRSNTRPLIVVTGINGVDNKDTSILVMLSPQLDNRKSHFSLDELVVALAPSLASARTRLFDEDVIHTWSYRKKLIHTPD